MPDYFTKAAEKILKGLNYGDAQLDIVGRIFSLAEDTDLVRFVEISDLTNEYLGLQPIIELNKPRQISLKVVLQSYIKDLGHDGMREKIKEALQSKGIATDDLFAYCGMSYGLEKENVDIHFGPNIRDDMKVRSDDNLKPKPVTV